LPVVIKQIKRKEGIKMIFEEIITQDPNPELLRKVWEPLGLWRCASSRKIGSKYYQAHFRGAWITVRSDPDGKIQMKLYGEKRFSTIVTLSGFVTKTRKFEEVLVKIFC